MTTLRLQVAVFGCGSSQYPKFCAAAVSAAEHLERLGAEFAVDLVKGDAKDGETEDMFDDWSRTHIRSPATRV